MQSGQPSSRGLLLSSLAEAPTLDLAFPVANVGPVVSSELPAVEMVTCPQLFGDEGPAVSLVSGGGWAPCSLQGSGD